MKSIYSAALLLTLLVSVVLGCWPHTCKDIKVEDVPGCHLTGKGCKCDYINHYQITLGDPVTRATGQSEWQGDSKAAARQAIMRLFNFSRGCNCQTVPSLPLGQCTLHAQSCFCFLNDPNMVNQVASFRLFVQVMAPVKSVEFYEFCDNATVVPMKALVMYNMITALYPACKPPQGSAAPFVKRLEGLSSL